MHETEILNKATHFYDNDDYKSALKYVERILKKDSSNASALIIKGNIFYQKKDMQNSLQCYLSALNVDSQNKIALINIANTYFELKDYEKSYEYSLKILTLDSNDKNALTILGNSSLELEKFDEGKSAFLNILQMDSSDYWSYNSLSQIYQKLQDYERALQCGWKAVELSNGEESQHINFGYLLYEIRQEKTLKYIKNYAQQWLEKYTDNPIVFHMANSVLQNKKIDRAGQEYVQNIFDAFAPEFEQVLLGLEYQAPQIIHNNIIDIYKNNKKKLSILDAGCGTGLCGIFLQKYAKVLGLYGVDISEKMLQQAKIKKVYNYLIKDDLEHYFFATKKQFDLIVSADVFTYLGNLQKIISGCYKCLKKNGRIIFTVSANNIDDSNYYLHPSGRFLHHKNYIKKLISEQGFLLEKLEENILRNEGENKVLGYVVCAIKT